MTKLLFFSLLLLIIFLVRTLQSTGTLILNLFCWWKHFQKIIKSRILLAKLKKFRITALATQTVCPQNVAYWPTVYKTGAAATGRIVATQFCPFQIVTVTVFLPWSRFSSATTTYTNGMMPTGGTSPIMEFLVANLSQLSLSTQYLFASKICWQVKRIKMPYLVALYIYYLIPKILYSVLQRQSLDMHT